MPEQLSIAEQNLINRMVRSERKSPSEAWKALQKRRQARKGKRKRVKGKTGDGPSKQAVYDYVHGKTHRQGAKETRGRRTTLTKADVRKLLQVRKRLIKQAKGGKRIRYCDVFEEAALETQVSPRTMENIMRQQGVRFRPSRAKVYLSEKDAKTRLVMMQKWIKKPAKFWTHEVHAFMDNKGWPLPLTPKQRAKSNATKVTGHLRFANEGTSQGFTRPRVAHSFLGIPSANIVAAVAKDRVIMWHECGRKWNGAVAAGVYKGPLSKALRRVWGKRKFYKIVEDGDRKGYQSIKAIQAKFEVRVKSMVLPPRTPSMMPLDAVIWTRIDEKMQKTAPEGKETREDFMARLKHCAKTLSRRFVARSIARTKENIQAIIDANWYHPQND